LIYITIDNSNENEHSFDMEIKVSTNNMFSLHVATNLVSLLVTNHTLKYVLKEEKTTSILTSHKWYVELIHGNENRFFEQF